MFDFVVPKPLLEVRVELPEPGSTAKRKNLKRKREFQDSFFDEKIDVPVHEISSDEEGFTKEVWKVEKILDRQAIVRAIDQMIPRQLTCICSTLSLT